MSAAERTVLHVLPHAGGGGDTYVDMLRQMSGYRFERAYVTPERKPAFGEIAKGIFDLQRFMRGYDVLHVHGEGVAAMFLPLLAARRSVATLHGLHLVRRVGGIRRHVAEVNLRAVVRAASRTICVSNAEREMLASVVGSGISRAIVVHNGAYVAAETSPAERARVRAELGLTATEPVGIWVGSLDERRDPMAVARAAERTSTALLFVGEGTFRADVERAANAHVRVLGQRRDVGHLLDASDFFVLMSQREGLSFALLEAMAHGLPALVADIPENVEAIGDSGLAVPYGDEEAIAAALRTLAGNAVHRKELGMRARRRIAERFGAERMIARTRAIYDDVAESA
jgi:glycosyltransferase involved in cell wall biosynthesis